MLSVESAGTLPCAPEIPDCVEEVGPRHTVGGHCAVARSGWARAWLPSQDVLSGSGALVWGAGLAESLYFRSLR